MKTSQPSIRPFCYGDLDEAALTVPSLPETIRFKLCDHGWRIQYDVVGVRTRAVQKGLSQIFVVNVLLTTTVEIPLPM